MKRLGMYTGQVYDTEAFLSFNIHECCVLITDKQAEDEEYIRTRFADIHKKCILCHPGCPESYGLTSHLKGNLL